MERMQLDRVARLSYQTRRILHTIMDWVFSQNHKPDLGLEGDPSF